MVESAIPTKTPRLREHDKRAISCIAQSISSRNDTIGLKTFGLDSSCPIYPVTKRHINALKQISNEDVRRDPAWHDATYVCRSNFERHHINMLRSYHFAHWYNNYNHLGQWNPHRKFILPSIEPLFRKVVSSMKKNQPVNIKQYHGLARQLGISYSGKTKQQLASLLDVWIQRYCNKTLYDDFDD